MIKQYISYINLTSYPDGTTIGHYHLPESSSESWRYIDCPYSCKFSPKNIIRKLNARVS